MCLLIFLGLKFEGNAPKKRLWFEPPGYVIPVVWVFLFLLLAILRYKLVSIEADELAKMTIVLAVVCASYAYYTLGLEKLTGISALKFGLFGNILVILVALWVGVTVSELSSNLSYLIFPIVAWTFFCNDDYFGPTPTVQKLIGLCSFVKEKNKQAKSYHPQSCQAFQGSVPKKDKPLLRREKCNLLLSCENEFPTQHR